MERTTIGQVESFARRLGERTNLPLFVERESGVWSLRYAVGSGETVVFRAGTTGELWNMMWAADRLLDHIEAETGGNRVLIQRVWGR